MKRQVHTYQRLYGVPFVPTNSEPENTSKIPPSTASVISCHDVVEPVKGSLGTARRYPALTSVPQRRRILSLIRPMLIEHIPQSEQVLSQCRLLGLDHGRLITRCGQRRQDTDDRHDNQQLDQRETWCPGETEFTNLGIWFHPTPFPD